MGRFRLTPKGWSILLVLLASIGLAVGAGMIYVPAGVIVGSLAVGTVGLLLIDVRR